MIRFVAAPTTEFSMSNPQTPIELSRSQRTAMARALRRAIDAAGGQAPLARMIGKQQGHISYWLKIGRVTAENVLAVEAATRVPRHELRPDLYPREDEGAAA